jgi:hypothetical protein
MQLSSTRTALGTLAALAMLAIPAAVASAAAPSVPAPKAAHAPAHHRSSAEKSQMQRARNALQSGKEKNGVQGKTTISTRCYGPYAMSWGWMAQCLTIVVDASIGYATLTENYYWSGSHWVRFAYYVN